MSKKKSGMQIYTKQDKAILYCGYALLALFLIAIIVPMIYIVIASFMDPVTLQNKGISFDFSKWSLDAYERVISDKQIWVGFKNAVLYSVIFTVISVAVTMLAAYPMSLPDFKGKKFFNTLFVITMFFNGGLIPNFILMNKLHLYNTFWVFVLPGMFTFYNMIIFISFFKTIPESLLESARLDGASEFRIYWQILLPNCKAVLATIGLYSAVYNWNDYYLGVIYIRNKTLQPLQTILYKLLAETTMSSQQQAAMVALGGQTSASTIKFAAMVVATLPILFIYPFIQKYLVKGVMIGSIKG